MREMTAEPHGSTRPRLRPFASSFHASAASRLHLPSGPAQRTDRMSYHHGPFGPYSAMSSIGTDAPVAAAFARGERHVRRRTRQYVDVEADLVALRGEVSERGRVEGGAAPAAGQPDLEALVLIVGRRRFGCVAAEPIPAFAGSPLLAARAREVGVARARLLQLDGRTRGASRGRNGVTRC